jgi:amidase
MARTVSDVATVLTALTGYDPRDPVTQESVGRVAQDYRSFLDVNGLKGARLGVARNYFGSHEGTDAIIEKAIEHLKALGAEIIDPVTVSSIKLFDKSELELFLYEFKAGLNCYLAEHPKAKVRSLEDLIHFNQAHAERVMPYFQQELLEMAQAKGDLSEKAYLEAKAECQRLSRTDGIDKAMQEHGLDAIIVPTDGTPAWMIDPIVGDKILGGCPSPAAMAGYPHITVPAGYVHGLPVGLSFFAGAYQEGNLIPLCLCL